MSEKIITIREPINTSTPTRQSFVADWSNFSRGGSGTANGADSKGCDDAERCSDSESGSECGSEGSFTYDSDDELEERPRSGADRDHAGGGFLNRLMNPFKGSGSVEGTGQPSQQHYVAEQQASSVQKDTQHDPSAVAVREIVSALSSATRSSSGDSIADLLDQIATSLRGIEVATRFLTRTGPARPDVTHDTQASDPARRRPSRQWNESSQQSGLDPDRDNERPPWVRERGSARDQERVHEDRDRERGRRLEVVRESDGEDAE